MSISILGALIAAQRYLQLLSISPSSSRFTVWSQTVDRDNGRKHGGVNPKFHFRNLMAGETAVSTGSFIDGHNPLLEPIGLFLLQIMIIITLARFLGFLFSYVRQPAVIAEVVGGILLGPTFLSRYPSFKETVFPAASLPKLQLVAEFGLILYLFLIGMELDPMQVVKTFKKSASISIAGIILPFGIGVGASTLIYENYISKDVPFVSFVVFCGVASTFY